MFFAPIALVVQDPEACGLKVREKLADRCWRGTLPAGLQSPDAWSPKIGRGTAVNRAANGRAPDGHTGP
jgi:hypothetical protein